MASFLLPSACAITTLLLFFLSPVYTFPVPISDVNGLPLVNGGDYFIGPAGSFPGGLTVTEGKDEDSQCPLYVEPIGGSRGLPIKISTAKSFTPILTTDLPIEFTFNKVPSATCNAPYRWYVAKKDAHGDQHVVVGTTHEFKDTYFFKIGEADSHRAYNIKFCHSPAGNPFLLKESCNDVGFLEDGLLGITPNEPIPYVFTKATPLSSSS